MSIIMSTTRNLNVLLIQILLLFCLVMASYGDESEINCLQEIKNSLLDPFNHFYSWDFSTNTEGYICKFAGVECLSYKEDRVTSLKLSNMGLEGQFPHCIENLSWLQNLNLSHNQIYGYIPSDISSKLPDLSSLDLSNNKFHGEIPKSIANLAYLDTLRLDGNQLSGQIPQELVLLPRIRVFSVANNLLSGPVPVFANNVDVSLSYVNNSGLCGGILGSCEESLFGRSFRISFVIAFASSATSVIVAFMDYSAPWKEFKRRRRSNAIQPLGKRQNNNHKDTVNVAELLPLALQEEGSKELSRFLERLIHRMSFMELCKATDYFSADNIMGLGTTGIMYKAGVSDKCLLAVKRLYDSEKYKREFLLEIMISGRHRHQNIAPLLGFCIGKTERILVYKYMSNGRLSDWLHPHEGNHTVILEWPERIHIALGLARGLSWLHRRCKIVHLNLASDCVLLDKNLEPKISNFGKAKFMNQTFEDHVRMSLFLIDGLGMKGSFEKDVYDFGIILFELITGKILTPNGDSSESVDSSLMNYICNNLFTGPSDFYGAIDKCITGKGFDGKILGLLEVACECVKPCIEQRPKMVDMYKTIRAMWEGYRPWRCDSERMKLSMGCPALITCSNEIECIY